MERAWKGHGKGMERAWKGHGKGMERAWKGQGNIEQRYLYPPLNLDFIEITFEI